MVFSPDGTTLASASGDNTVKLWDGATREEIATLEGHTRPVLSVVFSPDGTTLASASGDNTVKLWDGATREEIATLEGHTSSVLSVVFSPDGTTLASASADGTVKLWDGASRAEIATLEGHTDLVWSVVFSPDGTTLASASGDNTVKLWDVASREEIATLKGHTYAVYSVVFSPDGTTLASASGDGTVKLWDVASREEIATLKGHTSWVTSVVFSPDGTTLASASADGTVKLWDGASGAEIATLEGHTDLVWSVVFSPDGTTLASASGDNTVKLWDVAGSTSTLVKISGDEQQGTFGSTLANPLVVEVRDRDNNLLPGVEVTFAVTRGEGKLSGQSTVEQVTTDANGRAEAILTLGPIPGTNTVEVSIRHELVTFLVTFNAEGISPYQIATLEGHTSWVYWVVFSPDGTTLASASGDGTVKLWDGATRENIATLEGHTSWVNSVVFSPDGTTLASASGDGTVKLWDGASKSRNRYPRRAYVLCLFGGIFAGWDNAGFRVKRITRSSCGTGRQEKISPPSKGIRIMVYSVVFSPDGTTLASASRDNTVKLWDGATRENIATLEGHTSWGQFGGIFAGWDNAGFRVSG